MVPKELCNATNILLTLIPYLVLVAKRLAIFARRESEKTGKHQDRSTILEKFQRSGGTCQDLLNHATLQEEEEERDVSDLEYY